MAEEVQEASFRRRFPRRQFKGAMGVLVRGHYFIAAASEIGEGGLLFQTQEVLPVGVDLVLNFFVPRRSFVTLRAQLLYVLPDKTEKAKSQISGKRSYGVRFHNLTFEAKRMIRDYIAEKTAQEAIAL